MPEKTVYEVISQGVESFRIGGRDVNARAYLSKFNFTGADQEKKVGVLSGGERNRLHLAMALKEEGNVLLLDEPTNDIDVNTLRALEEGLDDLPAVQWLSATTDGSLTVSARIYCRLKAMVWLPSLKAHTVNMRITSGHTTTDVIRCAAVTAS